MIRLIKIFLTVSLAFAIAVIGIYYSYDAIRQQTNVMDIEEYTPISTIKVPENAITYSKYSFFDVHNNQFDMPVKDLSKLVHEMNALNMAFMVNLSGFRVLYLKKSLANIHDNVPIRFGLFLNVDFELIDDTDFTEQNEKLIAYAVAQGVIGLKVYELLGLTDKDRDGNRIAIDDPRLDHIWSACGKHKIPVLIHSAEPFSFWDPKDEFNER
ncbi:MAG: hypothetical protein P8N26_07105 [Cyclobacteriaceae bacterium]|nr:hypothetical protein [Cyclobacteriaceae bacterium]